MCYYKKIYIRIIIKWVRLKKDSKGHKQAVIPYQLNSRLTFIHGCLALLALSKYSWLSTKSPSFLHGEPLRRRRSHIEASTLLDPTFSLVTRAMSTRLAVSKSRPIRDTRRPLPTHKVAEAPLSPGSTRGRRTEGKRGRGGERVVGHRGREGPGTSWRVVRTDGANTTLRA